MKASELRQKYIQFYESKGHLHLPGSPLPPVDALGNPDTSTLFTSAGMQQFKPYFAGAAVPPSPRICTVQKCVRTVDIDAVGDTSHCTFFEMLGNFSFGDYFKAEVIPWTWEFLTEVCGIDPNRMCVTVYQEDEEAFSLWRDGVGLPEDRIHRLGADKNYWPANVIEDGPDGPCGPCSEYFYRVSPPEQMCSDPALTPTERFLVDDEAGHWLELGNNVFTQFDRSLGGNGVPVLTPLPKKNNDTGMGFDRIAFVVQGKTSVFETDLFRPILERVEGLSGQTYTGGAGPLDFAFRVVAEHVRSMTFCIADGILPSNEGRGYVLRYIMRRAIRYGKTALGFEAPFLHLIAPLVIAQMGDFYTELREREDLILRTIRDEEERFLRTLDGGMARLVELLETPEVLESRTLPGGRGGAFTLYDTYGFPIKLTQEMAEERGISVDLDAFTQALAEHSERSKAAGGEREVFGDYNAVVSELQKRFRPTEFVGYDQLEVGDAAILAIIQNGHLVETLEGFGAEADFVLDRTPLYAESGGQAGDSGWLTTPNGVADLAIEVTDTKKIGGFFLHHGLLQAQRVDTGAKVEAEVNVTRRRNIMKNHTATHLLQAALREVLGGHVYQKGSSVNGERLRFDFTHSAPVGESELREVERIVNAEILKDEPVLIHNGIPISEAKEMGAMALFGEKYGDRVRVVDVPGFSVELCGGTHVAHLSQIGLFKIVSEGGVASGVRRIEAVTGAGALAFVTEREEALNAAAAALKTKPTDVPAGIEKLKGSLADLKKSLAEAKKSGASASLDVTPVDVNGVPVITLALEDRTAEDAVELLNTLAQTKGTLIAVLASGGGGKIGFVAKVTPDLVSRGYHAGNLIREVAKIAGGNGGGRPDFAQAGGKDAGKIEEALAAVPDLVRGQGKTSG